MTAMQMFHHAVRQALSEDTDDPGQAAGEIIMTLARDRGMDASDSTNLYRSVVNHAAAADIVTAAIRKRGEPPWRTGDTLRRFLAVSSWNEERLAYESRSWHALGEVCVKNKPMQMIVAILGQISGGRRHGYWSKALLHPQRSSLRFKRRTRKTIEGFKETWIPCWREENDQISRDKWLQSMHEDGVLRESLFIVNIPIPEETERVRILDLYHRQSERLRLLQQVPEKQLSTCDGPLAPCPFRCCCWSSPESYPQDGGFDRI